MHKNKAADQAWERYKTENSHVPRRSLRKREFIAGWMARAQYQPSVLDDLFVSSNVTDHLRDGKYIVAIKTLMVENENLSLAPAKAAVDLLRAEIQMEVARG